MPAFHIVVQLLVLRLLLLLVAGLFAPSAGFEYGYGYHPSAEEFDSLLRETRSWTRDLLADGRRQSSQFVPRYNQQSAMATPWQKIDRPGELDFVMFSDELDQQPTAAQSYKPAQQHVQSGVIEVFSEPTSQPKPKPKPKHKPKPSPNLSISSDAGAFPIFFTNPATGIVYAITEVGRGDQNPHRLPNNHNNNNESIPIYVTKAQYDADLQALRQRYEATGCSSSSTRPPAEQIIRLAMPTTTLPTPLASNKLPFPSSTPKTRTKKTKRKKKKKKQKTQRRPGHRPTTAQPKLKLKQKPTPAVTPPQIVLGRRTTTTTNSPRLESAPEKLATQLEKPNNNLATATSTIFSQRPIAVTSGYLKLPQSQLQAQIRKQRLKARRRRRRSVAAPSAKGNSRRRQRKPKKRKKDTKVPPHPQPQSGSGNHRLLLLHLHRNSSEAATTMIAPTSAEGRAKQQKQQQEKKKKKRRGSEEDVFSWLGLGSDENEDDDGEAYDDEEDLFYYEEADKVTRKKQRLPESVESQSNLKEDATQDNNSSAEESADFGAMEEPLASMPPLTTAANAAADTSAIALSVENESEEDVSSSKHSQGKKRIRRRPPGGTGDSSTSEEEYYDDDEDEEEDGMGAGIGSFFRMIFYPVQLAMTRIFDGFAGQSDADEDAGQSASAPRPSYPSYTLYHSAYGKGSNEATADEADDAEEDAEAESAGSLGSWLSSWFGLRRRTKKIGSTTVRPLLPAPLPTPTEEPGWLESWFGYGKTTVPPTASSEDDDDKWFFGWFDTKAKPKARRRTTTSTTSTTTTAMPQVPILTILDPLRNPQNWIGILAHHIANSTSTTSTSTTTHHPLGSSSSTTEHPDVPRRISYEKYQIWRLKPQDEAQVRTLDEFKKGEDGMKLQWLKGPSLRGLTDVLVPPRMLIDIQGTLSFEGIAHEVLIFDVGKAIAYEQAKEDYLYTTPTHSKRRPSKPKQGQDFSWNKYYAHDDILKYLETMRMRHAQLVELIHIGRSYEGRPLVVVKIESKQMAAAAANATSHKRLKHKRKSGQANAVFIEAGQHGLAWIGPAAATWMISELLRHMRSNKTDPDYDFIRNTTWYIMPMLNPDGYIYSHEYDRFWKKSRSQHVAKPPGGILDSAMTWLQQKKKTGDKICYGVDLDRNWQYHWGKRGSSKTPCNELYAGPTPFSEPETKAVSEFLMEYRTQIKLYISLQAYGQVVSYPVKANSTFNTERMDDFLDVAMVGTDGLRKKGSKSRYKVDSANDLIEHRSGCADAFAAYEIGIPFSYTLQLADNGVHGYLLPSSAIEPTARDAFEIITGMLDYI